MSSQSPQGILDIILQENEGKFGIICLNCLIVRTRFKELENFVATDRIPIPDDKSLTKLDYLDHISIHFYNKYNNIAELQNIYPTCLAFIADMLFRDEKIKKYLSRFDFIAKSELIDVFADYCADLGIDVYDTSNIDESKYNLDLYLIKKKPFLRTEAVLVRTGPEMTEEEYKNTFYLLNEASKIAAWTVFVTTPKGVYHIGLQRLISDMEKLNVWFYVVDPIHQRVLGITKGKKSKDHDTEIRDAYIKKLPREPIRAQSRLAKLSNYEFSESESYNPKRFVMYEILPKDEALEKEKSLIRKPRYRTVFRTILIIDKISGVPLIDYSREDLNIDQELVSGFLSAMDSFVSEISGAEGMDEIKYKGFYIHAVYGQWVKLALFLSEPAKKGLKERLAYFLLDFEERYSDEINKYLETSRTTYFDSEKIITDIKDILDI
ncbi:MAG: hypothetical protein JSV62_01625 [Promethearchaeota archaeon]|nr:MAG: hypothetical protein JSV62_01625 [Candidatus Lokiarchaeota archaeon]